MAKRAVTCGPRQVDAQSRPGLTDGDERRRGVPVELSPHEGLGLQQLQHRAAPQRPAHACVDQRVAVEEHVPPARGELYLSVEAAVTVPGDGGDLLERAGKRAQGPASAINGSAHDGDPSLAGSGYGWIATMKDLGHD